MEVISKRQVRLFVIILVLDGMLAGLPNRLIALAGVDAWVSCLLAMAGLLLPLWAITQILARFPGKDLFGILVSRFPVMGRGLTLLIVLFIFTMLMRDIRTLTEFVTITLIPNTPLAMISMLIVIAVVVTARGGLEVVARVTELWLPLAMVMLVVIPFLLFPEFEVKNLLPMFDGGLIPPLQGSWYGLAYMGQMMILPFLLPSSAFSFKEGLFGLAAAVGLTLWTLAYMLLSMGTSITGKFLFPLYETVRLIRVTDFLDRFDLPFLMIYLPLMLAKVALFAFAVAHGIRRIIPAVLPNAIMGSFGAWCFVCSLWFFKNANELFHFMRSWSVLAFIFEVVLPLALFAFLRPKQQKGKPAH
ncbi:MAG: spore germination protein [Paenibacillaceae bacterium]|jgi:spore germination protein|nr:spore germination protein [Paenibacillaceae bacterium]